MTTENGECLHKDLIKKMDKKLDSLLEIMLGNGKTGICAKVNLLWGGSVFVVGAVIVTLIKTFIL